MEILVKILSIGELREIPLTQTDGSVKLLAKREFEITNGSATKVKMGMCRRAHTLKSLRV